MWDLKFALLFVFCTICVADQLPCIPKLFNGTDRNQVCVCNSTYCDTIERVKTIDAGTAVVIKSSQSGTRFQKSLVNFRKINNKIKPSIDATITVNASQTFQEIIGFGGAFTDSAGINIASLPEEAQKNLLRAYFAEEGLEYTLGRVPIASCDFSTHEYSYEDVKEDFALKNFNLTKEDLQYKIPYILTAMNLTGNTIRLFASPWSAPGWMKTTGRMKGGGALRNDSAIFKTYADYLVKFFEKYAGKGVPFWGMTVQNEPNSGADPNWGWQTMYFTAESQRDFLKHYLGPALKANKFTEKLEVMILDDNRFSLPGWADVIFSDPEASKYASGIGIHWYFSFIFTEKLLAITHRRHPDKFILSTEACSGYYGPKGPILGDWFRADQYAMDIITDLNNYVAGWTDWNLCLDEKGGPNWVGNVVDAPIIVNKTSGEFYKQPMFYALGHFSKFIQPGSKRIGLDIDSKELNLRGTAFADSGRRILILHNRSPRNLSDVVIRDAVLPGQDFTVDVEAYSIMTILWDKF